jgi:hypothetical protein
MAGLLGTNPLYGALYEPQPTGILSQPQPQGLLGAATVNPLMARQIAAQRAANPRPDVTDLMGYGPTWQSYLQNMNTNLQAQLPQLTDSGEQMALKGYGMLGNLGLLGMTSKLSKPLAAGPFAGVTREQFLGHPKITSDRNADRLRPYSPKSVEAAPAEPFLGGKYTAKFDDAGVAIYDGDKVIGSYDKWHTLVVDPKYRRQGIGEEMVYQWRSRHPDAPTAQHRTKAAQSLQEKVWERVVAEADKGK